MNRFLSVLCIAVSVLFIISCKKDDDDISAGKLVGTWRMTELYCNNGKTTTNFLGIPIEGTFTYEGIEYNTTTTFTENPNEFTSSGSYKYRATTVIGGETDITEETVSFNGGTGTWELDGDILRQMYADTTTEMKVLELTNDVLRTQLTLDVTVNDPLLGITITTKGDVFTRFEKE